MNPISILIVDDMSDTREVMAECLTSLGHHVTCAAGGREAMSIVEDRVFDLVITDMIMPDADGVEVIMAVRKAQPTAQVIAMTGGGDYFTSPYLLKLAGSLGADERLSKPFSRRQLLDAIERLGVNHTLAGAA